MTDRLPNINPTVNEWPPFYPGMEKRDTFGKPVWVGVDRAGRGDRTVVIKVWLSKIGEIVLSKAFSGEPVTTINEGEA